MQIIGIIGKKESGKTTVAHMIEEELLENPFVPKPSMALIIAFSDALKEILIKANLCTREEVYGKKTDFSRMILQKIGTEIIRDHVDEDFWVKKMDETLNSINHSPFTNFKELFVIIHDVRFRNEAEFIKEKGGVLIKILRDETSVDNHRSEAEQSSITLRPKDYLIMNRGSLKELRDAVSMVVGHILKRKIQREESS